MGVYISFLGETLTTYLTRVGLLPRVDHHMGLEVSLLGEQLMANRAEKLLVCWRPWTLVPR